MHRRQPVYRSLVSAATFATLMVCSVANAARSDGRTWWDEKRHYYPQCSSFTNEHERLTNELDRLAESARYAREPQRAAIVRQINATAAARNRVQDDLFACIRASGQPTQTPGAGNGQPRRPPLVGGVEQTDQPQPPPPGERPPQVPPQSGPGFPPGNILPPGGGGTIVPPGGGIPPGGGGIPGGLPAGEPGGTPGGGWRPPSRRPIAPVPSACVDPRVQAESQRLGAAPLFLSARQVDAARQRNARAFHRCVVDICSQPGGMVCWPAQQPAPVTDGERPPGAERPPNSGPIDGGLRDTDNSCPVTRAVNPTQAYAQGFLEGFASCLGSALIGPIQQIWIDAGIYARFSAALLQGDSDTAATILQIKGDRDRRTFDAFIKSLNPNVFRATPGEAGRRDGARLCALGIIPGVVRAAAGRPGTPPAVRNPPSVATIAAGSVRALLADLSWLKQFNITKSWTSCSNHAVQVDLYLGGKPLSPAMPSPALFPATIEMFYGRNFGARMLPDFVELTMRNRGDLKRAIIRGDSGPGTRGHQFNIIVDGRTVHLLDSQVGRPITWAELASAGYTEFQLLFTN